jgi:hypothetical protein
MQRLRDFAENEFVKIFDVYTKEIYTPPEAKQDHYTKPAEISDTPISIPWILLLFIDALRAPQDKAYKNHLYLLKDGSFKSSLNAWE